MAAQPAYQQPIAIPMVVQPAYQQPCCCGVGGCCHTDRCCCGCVSQKIGIIIAGAVDIALVFTLAVLSGLGYGLLALSNAIVIIGDILLIVGVAVEIPGLLIVWLVIGMLNLVYLFCGWIWIPVFLPFCWYSLFFKLFKIFKSNVV